MPCTSRLDYGSRIAGVVGAHGLLPLERAKWSLPEETRSCWARTNFDSRLEDTCRCKRSASRCTKPVNFQSTAASKANLPWNGLHITLSRQAILGPAS